MSDEVFISYSHDSTEHMEKVRALADKLRSEGVNCDIDQYEESPPEGWPQWMDRKVRNAKFVLVVCTEPYAKRFDGTERTGTGLGAKWEGGMIVSDLYESEGKNVKFIPVIFDFADRRFTPRPLRDATYYNVSKAVGYDSLYGRLTDQKIVRRPVLGKMRNLSAERLAPLPEKDVKSTPAMLLASPIDRALWDVAKWRGLYLGVVKDTDIPILGFGFENQDAAQKIFEGWRERFGNSDSAGELRVSFIQGKKQGAFAVNISSDVEYVTRRLASSEDTKDGQKIIFQSRGCYAEAGTGTNLDSPTVFQARFEKHQKYYLAPYFVEPGKHVAKTVPTSDFALELKNIVFRSASEITPEDLDYKAAEPLR